MTFFGKIALGWALSLALLSSPGLAEAASSAPKAYIPPRTIGPTVCDSRGCFGFGSQQWYRPPGYGPPTTPPLLNDPNRFQRPPVYIPPRNNYVPPKTNYGTTANDRKRHQIWCAEHYRTYNPGTNRYTSLRRGVQVCRSPYY